MSEQQAEKLLAVLVLARSSSYLMSKFVLGELDTFNLLALRFLIAFAVLLDLSLLGALIVRIRQLESAA